MDLNFSLGLKFVTLTYKKPDVTLDEASKDFETTGYAVVYPAGHTC